MEYESVMFAKMNVMVAESKGYSLVRQKQFEEGHVLCIGFIRGNVGEKVCPATKIFPVSTAMLFP